MNPIAKRFLFTSVITGLITLFFLLVMDILNVRWLSPSIILGGAIFGVLGGNTYTYLKYQRLSEDCNCEVGDIYYAIEDIGWSIVWIQDNASSFNYYLDKEKLKRKTVD